MAYEVILSVLAQNVLARLPADVRRACARHLRMLAESPTALSRPSAFPYREKCQLYRFDIDQGEKRWELAVLFQYGQDE